MEYQSILKYASKVFRSNKPKPHLGRAASVDIGIGSFTCRLVLQILFGWRGKAEPSQQT